MGDRKTTCQFIYLFIVFSSSSRFAACVASRRVRCARLTIRDARGHDAVIAMNTMSRSGKNDTKERGKKNGLGVRSRFISFGALCLENMV